MFVFENGNQPFFELATTLKNLGAKYQKKIINFTPCIYLYIVEVKWSKKPYDKTTSHIEGDDKNIILVRQKHCKAAIINKEEMAMAKDAFDYCLSLIIN